MDLFFSPQTMGLFALCITPIVGIILIIVGIHKIVKFDDTIKYTEDEKSKKKIEMYGSLIGGIIIIILYIIGIIITVLLYKRYGKNKKNNE
jgi:hypothetical protein